MIRPCKRSVVPIATLVLALALRLAPWGQNRFLEDEALYAYWGLQIATGADSMLDQEPVDKPPLHPYTLALSFILLGQNETAARLPSLLASVVGVALLYALARSLFGDVWVGMLAALLLALSPFDILFASTAFTDPLMTAFVLGSLLAAAKGRIGAAGVLAGLAAATKQQSLLCLPLVIAIGLLCPRPETRWELRTPGTTAPFYPPALNIRSLLARIWSQSWVRFILGFALVTGGVLWWDAARMQRPGFLEQGLISYGGLGPAQSEALDERASAWLRLVGDFWASPWFNALLVGAVMLWPAMSWARIANLQPPVKVDAVFAAFIGCFLALHWLVGFQVWDRYLLSLVPLAALLAARALAALGSAIRPTPWRKVYTAGLGMFVVLSLVGPVAKATHSELPVGGDHGAYDGIDALADYVRNRVPPGAVLYHYCLGYHYRFYLYGAPLRLHWYPTLADLAHDAYVYRREPRYIAFPSWRDSSPEMKALANVDVRLVPVLETTRRDGSTSFLLYRIEGP